MIINIIGDCDKRPVLYTVMKIAQFLGDVLLVTSSSRLIRLSDTHEQFGHYQNTMIAVTQDGIDDFWEEFKYDRKFFETVIIDNIVSADADITIYCKGLIESEMEAMNVEYIDDIHVIDMFNKRLVGGDTLFRCEEFEAYRTMCPINSKIAQAVADILAPLYKATPKNFYNIAMADTTVRSKKGK